MHDDWRRYFSRYAEALFPAFAAASPWNYKDDICMVGLSQLYEVTGEAIYREALLSCGCFLCDAEGRLARWDDAAHNLDFVSFGKSLYILYDQTGNEAYRAAVRRVRENLKGHPRTASGGYWHKDIYPFQIWLDGLYMALPFQAHCDREAGDTAFTDILSQFEGARQHLYVPEKGLYIHAWDESGAMEWASPETHRSPCFWLRAEGWYLMALCDVYEQIAPVCPGAERLSALLQEAVGGLLPWRDAASGLFLQLIDRADLPGNYPETSGSAMVAYALMKGQRLGMLKDTAALGREILEDIRRLYLSDTQPPTLSGICASAGLGPGPDHRTDRDGSPAYYLSERQIADNQHGAAACMMAAAEAERL